MQAIHEGGRWVLRLDQGQDLFTTLGDFARVQGIRAGAVLSGIGMLRSVTIGFWNGREYAQTELPEPHELVALHGSIAEAEGSPSVHLHAALAGPDHRMIGGHLVRGTVWVLGELVLEAYPGRIFARPIDETLGLRKLDLEPDRMPPP